MEKVFRNGNLLIHGKMIACDFAFDSGVFTDFGTIDKEGVDLHGASVYPALFDVHTHGALGYDFNNASQSKINEILAYYASHGVASVLPTIMTDSPENICSQLSLIAQIAKTNSQIKGIHLEGPFLSKTYKGAMPEEFLQKPNCELFDKFQKCADGLIKYVTISPELDNAVEFTKYLVGNGVTVSLGHSGATSAQSQACVDAGAKNFTHIFNAMAPIEHHNPSIIVNALSVDNYAEAILDGKHLNADIVKMLYAIKKDKLVVITDSISPTGMPNGEYLLGNTPIEVADGDARIIGKGTRAGSTLNAFDGVKNLAKFADIPLSQAVYNMTATPSKLMGLFDKIGSLDLDKQADFIIVIDNEIFATYSKGERIFSKEIAK